MLYFLAQLYFMLRVQTSAQIFTEWQIYCKYRQLFGRAMETIDRAKMCVLTYPTAIKHFNDQTLSIFEIKAAIAATAEGYSFPTNLDNDPPKGGLAPETQQALFVRALENGMDKIEFEKQLKLMENKKTA